MQDPAIDFIETGNCILHFEKWMVRQSFFQFQPFFYWIIFPPFTIFGAYENNFNTKIFRYRASPVADHCAYHAFPTGAVYPV